MQIIPYLIATLIPLVVLYIIYRLDYYKQGTFRLILGSFFWGAIALWAAYVFNSALLNRGLITHEQFVRYEAPIAEEILKALILIILIRLPQFNYFVDGAIYGFAIGIGFAVVENYTYLNGASSALFLAIMRVISTNLMHASSSAMIGISFGYARFKSGYSRYGMMLLGLLLAMVLHVAYNNGVDRVRGLLQLSFAVIVGIAAAITIGLIMRKGLSEEKGWIEESLGMEDRVSEQEARVVRRFTEMNEILAPLAQKFGKQKAAKIEKFLTTQAQLGIKRKSLEKLSNDERMRNAIEKEMAELRNQMDKARREVGAYVMLYVRTALPSENSPVWERLQKLIQERTAARPATGGMNLWANLEQKTKKANPQSPIPPTGG